MRCLVLLVLPFLIQDPADPVRALIEKLGSDDIVTRDQAALDLNRLGRKALPALNEAAGKSTGELRKRIDAVVYHVFAFGAPVLVTLEVKDRPLHEVAAELEKQTGVPVRISGARVDATASVSAKNVVLWEVVEDLCRARGDLMYRFANDAVEVYSSKFRALPSVDHGGLRFFIDRFVWDGNQFWQYGAVLAPPGARVIHIHPKQTEFVDDLGNDPLKRPLHRSEFVFWGAAVHPTSRRMVYPFYFNRLNDPPPSKEANKIVRCRGSIEVWLAGRERMLATVANPLAAPSTPAGSDAPSLGIKSWRIGDGNLVLDVTASWPEKSLSYLSHRLGPRMFLRFKDGHWRSVSNNWQEESRPNPDQIGRINRTCWFPWPEGSEAASLDFVAPDEIVKVEIPFDFSDIPLR